MRRYLFVGIWCVVILGCSQQPDVVWQSDVVWESAEDRVPQDWKADEIAPAVMDKRDKGVVLRNARILIWKITEDERARSIEMAIAWLWLEKDGQSYWTLGNVFRWPWDSHPKWQRNVVFDTDQKPKREFDHAPTNEEIYKFLKDTWWVMGPEPEAGLRLVDGSVCATAWKEVTGEEPAKPYQKMGIKPR
jgi:hypothetical protein